MFSLEAMQCLCTPPKDQSIAVPPIIFISVPSDNDQCAATLELSLDILYIFL